jgi:hypothetical protein
VLAAGASVTAGTQQSDFEVSTGPALHSAKAHNMEASEASDIPIGDEPARTSGAGRSGSTVGVPAGEESGIAGVSTHPGAAAGTAQGSTGMLGLGLGYASDSDDDVDSQDE